MLFELCNYNLLIYFQSFDISKFVSQWFKAYKLFTTTLVNRYKLVLQQSRMYTIGYVFKYV